jgi:DNA-binding transcriptional regulator GbsR (MarR family)
MAELLTVRQLAEKAGISPTNLRRLLRKEFNRVGKTKVEGNRKEYRFAANDPIVKQIVERAKTLAAEKSKAEKLKTEHHKEV